MIDICQWRATIGLWNCCQESSRLGKCHSPRQLLKKDTLNKTHRVRTSKSLFLPLLTLVLYLFLIFATETRTLTGSNIKCITDTFSFGSNAIHTAALLSEAISNYSSHTYSHNLVLLSGDVELNPGPITDSRPKDLLRLYSDNITQALSVNILTAINKLHANGSITLETKEKLLTMQKTDYEKATELMIVLQRQLESFYDPKQRLEKYCNALVSISDSQLMEIIQKLIPQLNNSEETCESQPQKQKYQEIFFNTKEEEEEACDTLNKLEYKFSNLIMKLKQP